MTDWRLSDTWCYPADRVPCELFRNQYARLVAL